MTSELADAPVNEWRAKALIREHVRRAVASIVAREATPFDEAGSAVYLAELEGQKAEIMAAQRRRDWSLAAELGASAKPNRWPTRRVTTRPSVASSPAMAL